MSEFDLNQMNDLQFDVLKEEIFDGVKDTATPVAKPLAILSGVPFISFNRVNIFIYIFESPRPIFSIRDIFYSYALETKLITLDAFSAVIMSFN